MIKRSLACAACVAAFAVSATAGSMDAPTPAPAIAPVVEADKSWAGFYGGLSVNQTAISGSFDPILEVDPDVDGSFPDVKDGTVGGAFVGFNMQRGNFVYGGELNVSAIDNEVDLGGDGDELLGSWDPLLDVRARVGYAINDVLVYGFAGKAFTALSADSDTVEVSGLSYGFGAQMFVYNDVFAGLEVSRKDLSGDFGDTGSDLEFEIDQISLRVGYNF